MALSFRTTDRAPLEMEARQKLARAINLDCCGEIQITISNADRYAGTVALELLLIDSNTPGRPPLHLGNVPVTSNPPATSKARATIAHPEILNFSIPDYGPLREFDEIRVIFHLDKLRAERSARISLDSFRLMPRGR